MKVKEEVKEEVRGKAWRQERFLLPRSQLQSSFVGTGLWPAHSCIYL